MKKLAVVSVVLAAVIALVPLTILAINNSGNNITITDDIPEEDDILYIGDDNLGYYISSENDELIYSTDYTSVYKSSNGYVMLADINNCSDINTDSSDNLKNSIFDLDNICDVSIGYMSYLYDNEYYIEKLSLSDSYGLLASCTDTSSDSRAIKEVVESAGYNTDGYTSMYYVTSDGYMIGVLSCDENYQTDIISTYMRQKV